MILKYQRIDGQFAFLNLRRWAELDYVIKLMTSKVLTVRIRIRLEGDEFPTIIHTESYQDDEIESRIQIEQFYNKLLAQICNHFLVDGLSDDNQCVEWTYERIQ